MLTVLNCYINCELMHQKDRYCLIKIKKGLYSYDRYYMTKKLALLLTTPVKINKLVTVFASPASMTGKCLICNLIAPVVLRK